MALHTPRRLRQLPRAALLLALPAAFPAADLPAQQRRAPATGAANGAPNTDVWLSRISRRDGALLVQPPLNLSRRDGYDNQPSFDARGRTLFYTRRAPNALLANTERDVQTDIWRYALDGSQHVPVAVTAESEYSAQVTPDGSALTVVRVERDSAQHLWRLPLSADGRAERLVGRVKPVGYYAWVDAQVAMFVLGAPATLQVMDTVSGRLDTIARDIGRGVKRVPGTGRVSFVQRAGAQWFIDEVDLATRVVTRLVPTLPGAEEYAWLDSTTIVAGSGTTLQVWTRNQQGWSVAADLSYAPLTKITRVTIDPTGAWLAFVAEPTPVPPPRAATYRPRVRDADVARDLAILAADSMEGRLTGSPGSWRATRWLAAQFAAAGLQPAGDSGFVQRVPLARGSAAPGARVRPQLLTSWGAYDSVPAANRLPGANVVGYIEGSDPALRSEYVLMTAHYDHIGVTKAVEGDSINNGADDDAAGTIAVLQVARLLARGAVRPKRTIIFAAMTGEEVGLLGTRWFIDHPTRPLSEMVANLEVEMIGRPDSLAGGAGKAWLTGYERSTLGDQLRDGGIPIVPDRRPAQRFFERSDNIAFARMGIPAHTLSSFNLHADYHTVRDEARYADPSHMARVIEAAAQAIVILANGAKPAWHPNGQPVGTTRPMR
ncbi:MAG: M20/M25/M40 family metallo-hydrolase [Gemmatimonadaceae bacterium]|nr:M20/M25/M40 family metallo-hydrolase [Gemmatimonadaceae bacterium]